MARTSVPSRTRPIVAALAGATGALTSFLVTGGSDAYVGAPIARWLVDETPASIVVVVLSTLGGLAEPLALLAASVAVAAALASLAFGSMALSARLELPTGTAPVVVVAVGWLAGTALVGSDGSALAAAGGAGAVVVLGTVRIGLSTGAEDRAARRSLLRSIGAAATAVGLGAVVDRLGSDPLPEYEPSESVADEIDDARSSAEERSFHLPGVPGLVSTRSEFYVVDVNPTTPTFDHESWSLSVDGAIERAVEIDYDQLRTEGETTITATLRCIGEDIDDRLLDTAVWTGLPLSKLLDRAEPTGEYAVMHAMDGYSEAVPLSYLEDALLVHAMNGETLPREHGFPARLVMPGTWGKINVKWVERIELREEPGEGYWSEQGWNATAPMRTVAKLSVGHWDDEGIVLGGHAYAGRRGIERVEVSLDDGETWHDAELSAPPDGEAVWRQWRYETEPEQPSYDVVVRAIDGEGQLQDRERSEPFPDGASGWVSEQLTRRGF